MKKWFTLVTMALMAFGTNAQELTVSDKQNSGCLGMTRSSEDEPMPIERIPTIILQKEGNILSVELQNYTSNCATSDFDVNSSISEGSEGSPSILSVNVTPVTGEILANCICPFNVSFTVRDLEVNSFYLKCWWYEGLVELSDGKPLVLEDVSEDVTIDGLKFTLRKALHKAMLAECTLEGELHIPSEVSVDGETYPVTSISRYAFQDHTALTKVVFPKTILNSDFEESVFFYFNPLFACTSLESIEVEEDNPVICSVDGVLFNKDKTKLICYPSAAQRTSYTVPGSVTMIEGGAFAYSQNLKKVSMSNEVKVMGSLAFFECRNLEEVRLSSNLQGLDNWTFGNCLGLRSMTIPQSVTYLGSNLFTGCKLETLCIMGIIDSRYITKYLFDDMDTRPNVLVPASEVEKYQAVYDGEVFALAELNNRTFYFEGFRYNVCGKIVCLDGPIEKDQLAGDIQIPDVVSYDGQDYTVTGIMSNAFFECDKLTSIKLPDSITEIGDWAFTRCSQLKDINLPKNLKCIGGYAFHNCSQIEALSIPTSVTTIGMMAFDNCISLRELDIPNSVQSIERAAFLGCTSLMKVHLPEGLERIDGFLFDGCTSLSEVNVPEGVNYIGQAAFRNCINLPALQLPQGLTVIDDEAFEGCTSFTEFTIPDKVESVGWDAFVGCNGLEKLTIGRSVKEMGGGTFYGCDNIRQVWSYIEEPFDIVDYEYKPGDMLLYGRCFPESVTREATLYVPQGTKEKYLSKSGWRDFVTISETISTAVKALLPAKDLRSDYYNLNGHRIQDISSPGLYIQNGKKYIVR